MASIQSDLDLLSSNFFGSSLSRPSSTSNGGSSIDKFTALAGEFGNGGGTVDYAAVYNAPGFDREGFDKALNEGKKLCFIDILITKSLICLF